MKQEIKKYLQKIGQKGGSSKSPKKLAGSLKNLKKAWKRSKERLKVQEGEFEHEL